MKNKDMPAMPHINKMGDMEMSYGGLTKREQAAITILAGLVANQFNCNDTADSLTDRAVELADKLFYKLEG